MTQRQLQEQVTKQEIRNKVLACLNADPELILNPKEDFHYLEFNDLDLGRSETREEKAERERFARFYQYERILEAKDGDWGCLVLKNVNKNGKKEIISVVETPEESRKRLFENIEEAAEKVRQDIKKSDGKLQHIEGELDLICNANDMEELKLFFRDRWLTLFNDDFAQRSPFNSLIKKNYKNVQNRVNELKRKLFDKGWELCSLAPLNDLQIEELTDNGYIPFLDWTGKTYKGFNPFDFTFSQVNELIGNGYQASDLEGRNYKGKDPFEKSKTEWDKFLNQNSGTETSSNSDANEKNNSSPNNGPNPPSNNDKNEEEKIINLLSQTQKKGTYEELATIISELKKYRSTNAYQKHKQEINQLEAHLKNLNPNKYRDTVNNLLDEQIKDSGLTHEELSAETKEAIEEAKKNTDDPEKVKFAEESLIKESTEKELNDIINSIKKFLARKEKSKQEVENFIKQLLNFINRNNYTKNSYEKKKQEVEKILAELRGKDDHQNQLQQKPFSLLTFSLCLAGLFVGVVIIGALVIKNKKRIKKRTWS